MTRNTVKRADLCNAVYQKTGLSRAELATLVELVLKEIADCLERGETVKLSSFGFSLCATNVKGSGAIPRQERRCRSCRVGCWCSRRQRFSKQRINAATGSADQVQLPRLSDMMKHR